MAKRGKARRRTENKQLEVAPPVEMVGQAATSNPRNSYLMVAVIVFATCLAYVPALHGTFLWDDTAHVTKPELRSAAGLYRIWFEVGATQQYYPLVHTAFWLEHKLWGDNVLGYHLTNVLLHAAVACLAYFLLRMLAVPGAWLAALFFALHPIHVESVAWISEQKNTLSAVFYLASMLTYLRFDKSRKNSHYAASLALFVLGLLCKTVTATLPAALLVIFWWQRGSISWRRDMRPLLPFFIVGATAGLFTAWVERTFIGAEGGEHELPLMDRILLAGRVPWFYLSKILWPTNLVFIYPRWNLAPGNILQWLFPVATLSATAAFVCLRSRWRAPLAAWLLFVGTLFPVLGFLNVYPFLFSFVANHFAYLASLAAIVIAAAFIVMGVEWISNAWRWCGYVFCLALVGTLGVLTWRESRNYNDAMTLNQTTLVRNPGSWLSHNDLGFEFARLGKTQPAIEHYRKSLLLKPDYSVAHYNLANQLTGLGNLPEAEKHYRLALEVRPDYAEARNNLGAILLRQGDVRAALRELELAIQCDPNSADAHSNFGHALLNTGDTSRAFDEFERSLKIAPDLARARRGLADTLVRSGKLQSAIPHYQQVLATNPDDAEARNSIGVALARVGRVEEAIQHFQEATRLAAKKPAEAITAFANLTRAYTQANRPDDAAATAEKAIQFAKAQGQPELATKIEAWLEQFRAEQAPAVPASATPEPAPASSQPPAKE